MSEEILRGSFKGKDKITVLVEGTDENRRLKFDATGKDDAKALAAVGGESEPKGTAKGS
jgi:ATP-dependent Clp protease ATP-binding subunit ClpC